MPGGGKIAVRTSTKQWLEAILKERKNRQGEALIVAPPYNSPNMMQPY